MQYEKDPTVLAGCLQGLSYLAYDSDGKTLEAVKYIIGKARYDDIEIMKAAIDCISSLIKYGNKKTAKEAISTLFLITSGPYTNIIQKYARQKIKNIV